MVSHEHECLIGCEVPHIMINNYKVTNHGTTGAEFIQFK